MVNESSIAHGARTGLKVIHKTAASMDTGKQTDEERIMQQITHEAEKVAIRSLDIAAKAAKESLEKAWGNTAEWGKSITKKEDITW